MIQARPIPRRRRWPPILLVCLVRPGGPLGRLPGIYGRGVAERTIDGWKAREAKAGRVYTCATQTIGGFPFGIELRCADAGAELDVEPAAARAEGRDMLVSAHVWQPTVLTDGIRRPPDHRRAGPAGDDRGQLAARADRGARPADIAGERRRSTSSSRVVDRAGGENLFKADRVDLDGRLVSGTVQDNPVIETVLKLAAASAPSWHPAAATPVECRRHRGAARPEGFRAEALAGSVSANCRPPAAASRSGARACSRATPSRSPTACSVCRRRAGSTASFASPSPIWRSSCRRSASTRCCRRSRRRRSSTAPSARSTASCRAWAMWRGRTPAPMIVAGVNLMGQPAELEGKRAVMLPLRFDDGLVFLGPLQLGSVPPLF